MKPDVILVNPYSMDYPLWRDSMEEFGDKFGKIINGFYQDHRGYDFREFIIKNTPWATSLDAGEVQGDWRNWTIKKCLPLVESEWVLFLEQDFVATPQFWDEVLRRDFDVAGFTDMSNGGAYSFMEGPEWVEGVRLHPSFILMKTALLEKTSKDFGAHPENGRDHFGTVTDELLLQKPKFENIYDIVGWEHYAGVSGNYMAVMEGKKPFGRVREFKEYVEMSMYAEVEQDPRFIELSKKCLE